MKQFKTVMRYRSMDNPELVEEVVNLDHVIRLLPGDIGQVTERGWVATSSWIEFTTGDRITVAGRPESVLASWRSTALEPKINS